MIWKIMSTWRIKSKGAFSSSCKLCDFDYEHSSEFKTHKKIHDIITQNGLKGYRKERGRAGESVEHVDWNYLYGSNGSAFKV